MTRYGIRPRFVLGVVLVFLALSAIGLIFRATVPGANNPQPYPSPPASATRELRAIKAPAGFRRNAASGSLCRKASHSASASVCFDGNATFSTRKGALTILSRFGFANRPGQLSCLIVRNSVVDTCNGEATWRNLLLLFIFTSDRTHHRGLLYGSRLDLSVLTMAR